MYNRAYSGTAAVTINDSTISDNHATGTHANGGGVANDGYDGTATITIENSTISGNTASRDGGGMANDAYYGTAEVTINDSTISDNTASYDGGGVANDADNYGYATVTIANSTISGNTASDNGGGVYNDASAEDGTAMATVTIKNSTISGNTASDDGGGVYNDAYAEDGTATATVTIKNSTISGNTASDDGGGVYNNAYAYYGTATATIANSTISGNDATNGDGGGVYNDASAAYAMATATATVDFDHSIVSGNTAGVGNEVHDDAVVTANDYNLFGDSSETDAQAFSGSSGFAPTVPSDINATQDGTPTALGDILDPRANNGGSTETHALVTGSPAIDHIPTGQCTATDQRGVSLPQPLGGDCDVGAFEAGPPILMVNKTGGGKGTVTSDVPGINCGADCAEWYDKDTVVTLTPVADGNAIFAGWSGDDDCSDGEVTMDEDKTCTALFVAPVGGATMPVNGLEQLTPATGLLTALVALATSGVALVKRRKT